MNQENTKRLPLEEIAKTYVDSFEEDGRTVEQLKQDLKEAREQVQRYGVKTKAKEELWRSIQEEIEEARENPPNHLDSEQVDKTLEWFFKQKLERYNPFYRRKNHLDSSKKTFKLESKILGGRIKNGENPEKVLKESGEHGVR